MSIPFFYYLKMPTSLRFWEWGCPKRRECLYHCDTATILAIEKTRRQPCPQGYPRVPQGLLGKREDPGDEVDEKTLLAWQDLWLSRVLVTRVVPSRVWLRQLQYGSNTFGSCSFSPSSVLFACEISGCRFYAHDLWTDRSKSRRSVARESCVDHWSFKWHRWIFSLRTG